MGEFLRRIRLERGLTLQQVAAETRIGQKFLEALEENRMEVFQGETSAKGFARVYGRFLNLDEAETMGYFSRWAQSFFRQKFETQEDHKRKVEEAKIQHVRKGWFIQFVIVVLMGLAVAAVVRMNSDRPVISRIPVTIDKPSAQGQSRNSVVLRGEDQSVDLPAVNKPWLSENLSVLEPPPIGIQSESPPVGSAPPAPVVSPTALSPGIGGQNKPAVGVQEPGGELTLSLKAVEESWVMAEIDGKVSREVILRQGEELVWKATKEFRLTLGNAGGIKASLNGRELPSFGRSGQVVKDILLKAE